MCAQHGETPAIVYLSPNHSFFKLANHFSSLIYYRVSVGVQRINQEVVVLAVQEQQVLEALDPRKPPSKLPRRKKSVFPT